MTRDLAPIILRLCPIQGNLAADPAARISGEEGRIMSWIPEIRSLRLTCHIWAVASLRGLALYLEAMGFQHIGDLRLLEEREELPRGLLVF